MSAMPEPNTAVAGQAIEDIYPLSSLQQGLLFHSLYEPESGLYLIQLECRLEGALDIAAFAEAWRQVLKAHPVLRTAFIWEEGAEPLQVILRGAALPFEFLDWQEMPSQQQAARWRDYLVEDRQRGFDLGRAPLTRLTLVRCSAGSYAFAWTHHHLVLDGWCLSLVLGDVFAAYAALRRGDAPPYVQRRPYRDYIAWLKSQNMDAAEAFWRERLAGFTAPTPLPMDSAALAPAPGGDSAEFTLTLSATDTGALQSWAKQQQLTMSTVVQGAWALLLAHYSGERDVLFGVTVSGRPAELQGVEEMVGLFINSLPLRIAVDPAMPLLDWLRALLRDNLEMRRYEYAPLVKIQDWSEVPRGQPLFTTLLSFENYPVDIAITDRASELAVRDVHFSEKTNYPLTAIISPGEQLEIRLLFEAGRYTESAIGRLCGHLQNLLLGMAARPSARLGDLSPLTEGERRQLLEQWNATAVDYPRYPNVLALFGQRVQEHPRAAAVVCGDRQFEYGELNAHANRLAHCLRARGVGPETRVGICMERSPELVVAILGILKAGGAYVPMDPDSPEQRIAALLSDCGAPLLLTQERIAARLPDCGVATVRLDRDWPEVAMQPAVEVPLACHPHHAAYVIYTSGSTGQPKGVVVSHANLLHSTLARLAAYPQPVAGFLLLSPVAFDSSVAGIFWSLSQGGLLCLPSEDQSRDPWVLGGLIAEHGLTHVLCLPSFYGLLLEQSAAERLASLGTVIVAGEACPPALPEKHRACLPGVALYNEYGPTEGTVWSTVQRIATGPGAASVPIGRPIANVRAYVVDALGNPAPVGVAGELHIAGAGLARGYLNRPDVTAERFMPNPFGDGERWYRTGDLVRCNENGVLEFLGRIDHQVKIRGFRVELGEIEARIRECPALQDAAVAALKDGPGSDRIVAYVVPKAGAEWDEAGLRATLAQRLPPYMVPYAFVALDNLPLNGNGKLDRKRLSAPEAGPQPGRRLVAPRTPVEESLARIWAEVLQLEAVGVEDPFFELGGDSIQAIQVTGRARQSGIAITPRQLFEQQTIANLAQIAGEATHRPEEQGMIAGEVALTPIQCWFFERNPLNPHHWNQSVLLQAQAPVDAALLEQALQSLQAHHDALRLRFIRTDSRWTQRHDNAAGGPVLQVEDLSGVDSGALSPTVAMRAVQWQGQLNISDGPLLQAVLFDCGGRRGARLLLVIHHLAVDGVSWRILVEDLQTAYSQAAQNRPIALPAKSTPFKRWSECLHEYAGTDRLRRDAGYWLGPAWERVVPLPVDDPAGLNLEKNAETVSARLSGDDTRLLLQAVPRAYATEAKDVLLATLADALIAWTGSQTALIELEGHGREDAFEDVDLSRTVGWFTSSFPVLLELTPGATRQEVLQSVAQQLRRVPQKGFPYGVARYLARMDGFAGQPKAQVAFNYLGQVDGAGDESALFTLAPEAVAGVYDGNAPRAAELEISAQIRDGKLELFWAYSGARYRRSTIEALAETQIQALRGLIRHSAAGDAAQPPDRHVFAPMALLPDWQAEMRLDPAIRPTHDAAITGVERAACFLTGTTGFVGTFLLDELLRKTRATVYCLVRAATPEDALAKIRAQRSRYGLAQPLAVNRIVPVCGDLALPSLGLAPSAFDVLAQRIDTIYHVGAATNLLQPYPALKAANVYGTAEILRLACTGRIKPVHYTSTLSVFNHHSESGPGEITEQDIPMPDAGLAMGYAQTKLVAEHLLRAAAQRGCQVVIYRLGTVTGHSRSGAWNQDDFYCRMLRTCVDMGLVPEPDDLIDMTPVDYVCEAIVYLSGESDSLGRTFHLQNPRPIDMDSLIGLFGYLGRQVRQITYDGWVKRLIESADFSESHVLYPFLPYFQENGSRPAHVEEQKKYPMRFLCRDTTAHLGRGDIVCPSIDGRLLQAYLSYLGCMTLPKGGETKVSECAI